jgi:hypothetical protein
MQMHWLVLVGAALIPLAVGFVWYHKAVFGKSWMRANRFLDEDLKGRNMVRLVMLSFMLSLMLSAALAPIVIHQFSLAGLVGGGASHQPDQPWPLSAMLAYEREVRTFRHGAFHGALSATFFTLPLIGIVALMERKSGKYILIHWGYWLVSLTLMGGVLCKWL